MKRIELKVARIGNSRGVRLPAGTLARYRIGDTVLMEERSDGILLLPRGQQTPKSKRVAEPKAGYPAWQEGRRAVFR